MKKQFRPLWLLGALAFVLSVGLALNAQQTTPPQGQSTDQQAQPPATPPAAQTPAPPTSDEPAPPPTSQATTPPASQTPASPSGQTPMPPTSDEPAPPPSAQSPAPPAGTTPDQAAPPSSSPSTPPPPTGAAGQASPVNGVQAFSGTVVKEGDRYMLHDEASGQTYDLDHQDEVQKYAGKRVRVHGTLDPAGKMIHLQ
jgi:hypothetical protein